MKKTTRHGIVIGLAIVTFIVPLVQLSIGFHYIVKDGEDAKSQCQLASDLPLVLAIGGIFALFFLGSAYGFLKMISSINKPQSDVAGHTPKILIGLISLIFGAITLMFFVIMQIRVYGAYANGVQFNIASASNYCRSGILRGSLAMIILTYISIIIFISIFILIICSAQKKRQEQKQTDIEMVEANNYRRL